MASCSRFTLANRSRCNLRVLMQRTDRLKTSPAVISASTDYLRPFSGMTVTLTVDFSEYRSQRMAGYAMCPTHPQRPIRNCMYLRPALERRGCAKSQDRSTERKTYASRCLPYYTGLLRLLTRRYHEQGRLYSLLKTRSLLASATGQRLPSRRILISRQSCRGARKWKSSQRTSGFTLGISTQGRQSPSRRDSPKRNP